MMRIVRYKPLLHDWFATYEETFIEDSVEELDKQEQEFREFIQKKNHLEDMTRVFERTVIYERLT